MIDEMTANTNPIEIGLPKDERIIQWLDYEKRQWETWHNANATDKQRLEAKDNWYRTLNYEDYINHS